MVKHDVGRTIKKNEKKAHREICTHRDTHTLMQADSHTGKNKIFNLDKQQVRGRENETPFFCTFPSFRIPFAHIILTYCPCHGHSCGGVRAPLATCPNLAYLATRASVEKWEIWLRWTLMVIKIASPSRRHRCVQKVGRAGGGLHKVEK